MIQLVNEGQPAPFTEEGGRLVVAPFELEGGIACPGGSFELCEWEGGHFRLYLDDDGSMSTDDSRGHYWQLAEAEIPIRDTIMVETDQLDDNGVPILASEKQPLNVQEDVLINVWALPAQEEETE